MIERIFYTLDEAKHFVGNNNLLREMIEFHGLRVYAKIHGRASHMDDEGLWEDTLQKNGKFELAEWHFFKRKNWHGEEHDTDRQEYVISGWFELSKRNTLDVVNLNRAGNINASSYVDGKHFGHFYNFEDSISSSDAHFRVADLKSLMEVSTPQDQNESDTNVNEKPLGERERTTLLCIIGALCRSQNIDLTQPMKSGDIIAAMASELGWSGRSIGEHLKKVNDAMDKRKSS